MWTAEWVSKRVGGCKNQVRGDFAKWPVLKKALEHRRDRVTFMRDVPLVPPAVPWISEHPANRLAWLADRELAALRHIQSKAHINTSMLPLAMGFWYSFFFREPPPTPLLISAEAYSLGLQRLFLRSSLQAKWAVQCSSFQTGACR